MVPHGAGVGVYVRGALSGLRPDARKSKHGLKTIFPNRLGRRSTVEPWADWRIAQPSAPWPV